MTHSWDDLCLHDYIPPGQVLLLPPGPGGSRRLDPALRTQQTTPRISGGGTNSRFGQIQKCILFYFLVTSFKNTNFKLYILTSFPNVRFGNFGQIKQCIFLFIITLFPNMVNKKVIFTFH